MTTSITWTGNPPDGHPTLLHLPAWFGVPEQVLLPLPADAYEVRERHPEWFEVRVRATEQLVYSGLGPIAVAVSRAPF
ncbi:hypothetical protein C8245_21360 [Paracidovorax avenae]|nr:hypothetical protein C8245_21360 [Paracidovorax avenae]